MGENDFLGLPGNHLAEFDHGRIEVHALFACADWRTRPIPAGQFHPI
jgi:hypothetical protein